MTNSKKVKLIWKDGFTRDIVVCGEVTGIRYNMDRPTKAILVNGGEKTPSSELTEIHKIEEWLHSSLLNCLCRNNDGINFKIEDLVES